ncbi:uncharacterized protein LOC18435675 isoform X2 [Amborella trichopoda]|uniref:FPL domain-containing protein n=1 Tax=Amborella trichopoda TaxID=13333 RepID=W1PIJ9_AMBTC|nr:uncharacterized protein LOC18435675 isoform X2 [Amborella trichopoda]ERN07456.1 hypothetical protein AMTR_s00019p00252640 [Amborella trichopoda]|eukprot:XP_020523608.1 uncharacterized protein LOC18435675 isoform X2 [Amborella trichopoda]
MWFSFWRSRNRFSLDELKYLTDQLQKIPVVSDINKDFVIETLRSIAELVTYGDQHDPTFFEFFMEKQVMGEFVRVLRISRTGTVALQLLQTMSIMIQNLKSEHAIYYIFSNEHINSLITYKFDFRNEELLAYYISFLRAISGKLDKNTISLLVKTHNDEVVSFPLYSEAIKFAFHEENMIRIAVRALTLNVYHVGDECVNRFVTSPPLSDYFSDLVTHFRKRCLNLDGWFSDAARNSGPSRTTPSIVGAMDEIEDNLYFFSDVISAGVPLLGNLITDNILQLLVFPMLLPSVKLGSVSGSQINMITSLYLLCCILRIVKFKDLASSISASLLCLTEAFTHYMEVKPNGFASGYIGSPENQQLSFVPCDGTTGLRDSTQSPPASPPLYSIEEHHSKGNTHGLSFREILLSYVVNGNEIQVLGSLSLLATLLQTKELDESVLDVLGLLPQRKQHKKLLLQALVGESSGEEKLFSRQSSLSNDDICNELDVYQQKLKAQYGFPCSGSGKGIIPSVQRYQVLDALAGLLSRRSLLSAGTLWHAGWLLRQLLPCGAHEFNSNHLKLLSASYEKSAGDLLAEIKGNWCDVLIRILIDEWKNCKKAIEASAPQYDLKRVLLSYSPTCSTGDDSSFASGERLCDNVKVFIVHRQLLICSMGGMLPEQPHLDAPTDPSTDSRAKKSGLDVTGPKPGIEINLVDAMPCRVAFERGKERHFFFLAVAKGTSGWILLAEELPLKPQFGVIRIVAPLAGSCPRIDDKHSKWLHLRVRPTMFSFSDHAKSKVLGKMRTKALVDGRWTLSFMDDESCKYAESIVLEELRLLRSEVEKRLKPLVHLERFEHSQDPLDLVSEAWPPNHSL